MRRSFIKSQNPECLTLISSNPNSQLKGKILNPTFFFLLKNKSRFKKNKNPNWQRKRGRERTWQWNEEREIAFQISQGATEICLSGAEINPPKSK